MRAISAKTNEEIVKFFRASSPANAVRAIFLKLDGTFRGARSRWKAAGLQRLHYIADRSSFPGSSRTRPVLVEKARLDVHGNVGRRAAEDSMPRKIGSRNEMTGKPVSGLIDGLVTASVRAFLAD
jgi:hypothetical protein